MQESCTYGSVRGAPSNGRPYRNQCALSSPTARAWSRPPDLAVSGGALNGHLTTPIGGRPATPRLTRREDRSAHPTIGIREQIAAVVKPRWSNSSSHRRQARSDQRRCGVVVDKGILDDRGPVNHQWLMHSVVTSIRIDPYELLRP